MALITRQSVTVYSQIAVMKHSIKAWWRSGPWTHSCTLKKIALTIGMICSNSNGFQILQKFLKWWKPYQSADMYCEIESYPVSEKWMTSRISIGKAFLPFTKDQRVNQRCKIYIPVYRTVLLVWCFPLTIYIHIPTEVLCKDIWVSYVKCYLTISGRIQQ